MGSEQLIDHETRISHVEAKCEEYRYSLEYLRKYIQSVNVDSKDRDKEQNRKIDRHEKYFNYVIGGWAIVVIGFFIIKGIIWVISLFV